MLGLERQKRQSSYEICLALIFQLFHKFCHTEENGDRERNLSPLFYPKSFKRIIQRRPRFAMSLLEINSLSQKSLDRIDILHILTVLP